MSDISAEQLKVASDMSALIDLTHVITEDIREMRKLMPEQSLKGSWDELDARANFSHALSSLCDRMEQ